MVPLASAANPHFVKARATVGKDHSLTVSFKEAGLGNNQTVEIVLTADVSVLWGCINGGGKHPKASNKESVEGPVSKGGLFTSGKNGQVTDSLSISADDLPMPTDWDCPPGQRAEILEATYSNILLCDTTNGVCVSP
jgi:hypothetical protein